MMDHGDDDDDHNEEEENAGEDDNSCAAAADELDFHSEASINDAVEREFYQQISSEPSSGDGPVLEFTISGQANELVNLAQSYLSFKMIVRAKNAEDTELDLKTDATGKSLSLVNNVFHTLFGTVEVIANQVHLSRPYSNYAYLAYLANLLGYGNDAKATVMKLEGWAPDKAGELESLDGDGMKERQKWISKGVELLGALKIDLADQHRVGLNSPP